MKKVKFSVGTNYVGSEIEEEFTLKELGIHEEKYETIEELIKDIEQAYEEWMHENANCHWSFID